MTKRESAAAMLETLRAARAFIADIQAECEKPNAPACSRFKTMLAAIDGAISAAEVK
jgi:hypothetical protein